jgi:hypothetical protein
MIWREDAQLEFGAFGGVSRGGGFYGGRLFGVSLAGLGYKNCGRVYAISETSDYRPVPHWLLIAFFKNSHTRVNFYLNKSRRRID